MHPEPTAEQAELKAAVRDFLAREVTPERLLAWEGDPVGVSPEVRRAVAALGWIGIGAPVAAGGSGAPLVDVACLLEECARGLLPRPLIGAIRGREWQVGARRLGARRVRRAHGPVGMVTSCAVATAGLGCRPGAAAGAGLRG